MTLDDALVRIAALEREVARLKEQRDAVQMRMDDWRTVASDRSVEINRLMREVARLREDAAQVRKERNYFEDLLASLTYDERTDTMTMPASQYRAAIDPLT